MKEATEVYVNTIEGVARFDNDDETYEVGWIGGAIPRFVVIHDDNSYEFLAENVIQVRAEDVVTPIEE